MNRIYLAPIPPIEGVIGPGVLLPEGDTPTAAALDEPPAAGLQSLLEGRLAQDLRGPQVDDCGLDPALWREVSSRCSNADNLTITRYVEGLSIERRWEIFAGLNNLWINNLPYSRELIDTHLEIQNRLGGRGDSILDVGASTGPLTVPLLLQGHPVVAIEPNFFMSRRLMRNLRREMPTMPPVLRGRFRVVRTLLEDFQSQGRTFPSIHARQVIHTLSPAQALNFAKALYEHSSPGGLVVVSGIDHRRPTLGLMAELAGYFKDNDLDETLWSFRLFSVLASSLFPVVDHGLAEVKGYLEKAGFREFLLEEHSCYGGMAYFVVAQAPIRRL